MAVRADLGVVVQQIVSALKAITTPVVYAPNEPPSGDKNLWGVIEGVTFDDMPRVSGTDQPDRGAVTVVVMILMRPDRAAADGYYALFQAASRVRAALDEMDSVVSGTTHRVEMKRTRAESGSGRDGDTEVLFCRVTGEGIFSREQDVGSVPAFLNEDA